MHGKWILVQFLALLTLLSSLTSQAQPVTVSEGENWVSLAGHLYWYRDASGQQSLDQIIQQDQAGLFTQANGFPSFGYTDDVIWVRLSIYNSASQHGHWLLSVNPPFRSEERRVGKECRCRWSSEQ